MHAETLALSKEIAGENVHQFLVVLQFRQLVGLGKKGTARMSTILQGC